MVEPYVSKGTPVFVEYRGINRMFDPFPKVQLRALEERHSERLPVERAENNLELTLSVLTEPVSAGPI